MTENDRAGSVESEHIAHARQDQHAATLAPVPVPALFLRHILYDIWVADGAALARVEPLRALLLHAASVGGATVLADRFEQFQPHGVTGFLLLAESHLSMHTWVEHRHAAIDLLTCGDMDIAAMLALLRRELRPVRERCREVARD